MQSLTDLDAEAILLNVSKSADVKPWSKTIATFGRLDYALTMPVLKEILLHG
jgi:hypothetical protein